MVPQLSLHCQCNSIVLLFLQGLLLVVLQELLFVELLFAVLQELLFVVQACELEPCCCWQSLLLAELLRRPQMWGWIPLPVWLAESLGCLHHQEFGAIASTH